MEEHNELIHELRVFMNAYGESDRRVVDLVKERILNLISEREGCYAEAFRLRSMQPAPVHPTRP